METPLQSSCRNHASLNVRYFANQNNILRNYVETPEQWVGLLQPALLGDSANQKFPLAVVRKLLRGGTVTARAGQK